MSKRWFSSVLIFALGFGCPSLVTNATAQELPEDRGELEEGLSYISTELDTTLVNTGKDVYLVMVQREPGTTPAEVPLSFNGRTVTLSKYSLNKAIAYRLVPIAVLAGELWRSCAMGDCAFIGPLPPPPPPTDQPDPSAIFLEPQLK